MNAQVSAVQGQPAKTGTPASSAAQAAPPLPPRRPVDIPPPSVPAPDVPSITLKPEPGPSACLKRLEAEGGVILSSQANGATGECGMDDPVTFQKINLTDGTSVTLESAITVRCEFAQDVLEWIRDDLKPITLRENDPVVKLTSVGGHACRSRNRVAGARISEHASGNALDLGGLVLKSGRIVELTRPDVVTRPLRDAIKASACARFMTVLGPGADSAHEDHIHLDMRLRSRNYRICQWNLE